MDKNKKPFKPGQLATIGNHIYRVTKGGCYTHTVCDFCGKFYRPEVFILCILRVPVGCYLKLIK